MEQQEKCPDCGGDPKDCGDATLIRYPQRHVCYITVDREALNWQYDQTYEGLFHDGTFTKWSEERTEEFPNTARDGVTLWVSSLEIDKHREWLVRPKDIKPAPPQSQSS